MSIKITRSPNILPQGLITPLIYPPTDSTTALGIFKADGVTNILNVDTTNSMIGIGTTSPSYKLDVRGSGNTGLIRSAMGFDIYQVPDPVAPTGVVSSGGSVDIGGHYYSVSYVTATGETHTTYSALISTTTGNNTVTLTIPVSTDARVTGRKIYRTKASSVFQYNDYVLTTVANNSATTYVDTTADSGLGAVMGAGYFRTNTTSNNVTVNGVSYMTLDSKGTYIGQSAGSAMTTGGRNTFVGSGAGSSATSATDCTFVGLNAGSGSITGSSNVMVGNYGLRSATSGAANTGCGSYAFYSLTTGSGNTAIGCNALYSTATSGGSTALGYYAGYTNTNANGVYIGYSAGQYETLGNKLFIDSIDRTNEAGGRSKSLIYGVFNSVPSSQTLTINGVIFPFQSATAAAPAWVVGGVYFDTTLNKLRIGGVAGWETVTSI